MIAGPKRLAQPGAARPTMVEARLALSVYSLEPAMGAGSSPSRSLTGRRPVPFEVGRFEPVELVFELALEVLDVVVLGPEMSQRP